MAQLDYAFVADFAQVVEGKLSAIGASFTHVKVDSLEGAFVFSTAGRVRLLETEPDPELSIRWSAPGGGIEVSTSTQLKRTNDSRPYDGKVGVLFSIGMMIPISEGLHEVFIAIDGDEVRRLAFDMAVG